jgi:hypothetical protein
MSEKNMEKYQVYKTMNANLSKAMRSEFYYQAIFIEYAIIEDRCSSVLRHAGVPYLNKNGQDISISQKLRQMRENPAFHIPYVRQRISLELIGDLYTWKKERDALIHHMAKIPYDHESIKATAIAGQELVKMLSNKVRSVNAYYEKQNSKEDG